MLAPPASGLVGRCPSCQASGPVGEPCGERICSLRGYCFIPDDGSPTDPEEDPLIGQRTGDYLLVGIVGVGGFGRVYRALQLPMGMLAAVKLLDGDGGSLNMAALKLAKFEIEAQALARLSHPNIVRLYQYGRHRGGAPYLAMELVENASNLWSEIETRAGEGRPFTLDEVQTILMQVLAALEAAHERQIVHRDIKPENIMLQTVPGHSVFVKVLDFGLAKFIEDRTATSMLLGTPAYMASEQITRGQLGPWTDFYALGVLAFELLTGVRPYGGADVQSTLALKLDASFDPWMRIADMGFPEEMRIFVAHALAAEPEARYATAADFREGLVRVLQALREAGTSFTTIPLIRLVESTPLASAPLPENVALPEPTSRLEHPNDSDRIAGPLTPAVGSPRPSTTSPTRHFPPVEPAPQPPKPAPASWRRWWWLGIPVAAAGLIAALVVATSDSGGPSPIPVVPAGTGAAREGGVAKRPQRPELTPVEIASGRFVSGSAPHDPEHRGDEQLHEVVLTFPLVVAVTEVTQADWAALFDTRPWRHANCSEDCPVDSVTWWDAVAYANALSKAEGRTPCYMLRGCRGVPGDATYECRDVRFEGLDCDGWRLPTEAEWEYLARAQSPPPEPLEDFAWFGADAPRSVASKQKNAWGLYDLFGNVREWVQDVYGEYPPEELLRDPMGPAGTGDRVVRGGGYRTPQPLLRAAARDHAPPMTAEPDLGFRLVRSVAKPEPE